MGRGLSELQKKILAVLAEQPRLLFVPGNHRCPSPRDPMTLYYSRMMRLSQVMEGIGSPRSRSASVSVSKALSRLAERKLIVRLYHPYVNHYGYYFALSAIG